MTDIQEWKVQLGTMLADLEEQSSFRPGMVFAVGCSTSEVIGEKIGTAGTEQVAEMIFSELEAFKVRTGVHLAFQCCEHLNRALVVEQETAEKHGLDEVTVTPVRSAGGAMATYAYSVFKNPAVVEFIKADGGIDIGDTFIGMHLKHVAVPVRSSLNQVGHAHVTMAKTRPKLIGGERAVYSSSKKENKQCTS
ncbi:TIGR01440 family protein [Metabacillus sp. cB07]|uniref:TIGR01440 family protein n=1 Tax=Metabacillus sp. cB07 TaxID=2806989 RepID=UPI0019395647|nr:TIGR01440 family protein [Metabacillus sp. cB07]